MPQNQVVKTEQAGAFDVRYELRFELSAGFFPWAARLLGEYPRSRVPIK